MRLLLAEDEKELSNALVAVLKHNNYSVDAVYNGQDALDYLEAGNFLVDTATNGIEGLNKATDNKYDLLLLDIMLPGVDGLVICSEIRKTSNVPILLASAKGDDIDKIRGLGLGADDYIVKPFSPGELVARVIAHIKRYERLTATKEEVTDIISIGNVKIDKRSRQVTVDQNEVALTNKEFDLITVLAENPNKVFCSGN